jgi:integral membrane protein
MAYFTGVEEPKVVERRYLIRYRVLALITATLLIILVFIGIPLQVFAGRSGVVNVVGTIHGFLYLAYLVVAFGLTRKLSIPKWQMALVLVAGTVPFCAFIAERKLTRRFDAVALGAGNPIPPIAGTRRHRLAGVRQRWFSGRALLLHLEVIVVAPGCVAAGWWQATRALAGNGLSWLYSVEWPIFAILAIGGWWRLIHEDPADYRARKAHVETDAAPSDRPRRPHTFDERTARLATVLAGGVGLELAIGVATLFLVRPSRPSGFVPAQWPVVYVIHAVFGLPLAFGAVVLLTRVHTAPRISRLSGWIGIVGIASAGMGGLLTEPHNLRLLGIVVMFLGTVTALFGYLIPTFEKLET